MKAEAAIVIPVALLIVGRGMLAPPQGAS